MTTTPPRFELLLERYHDEIYAYLWRLLGGNRPYSAAADAQDLTQEVFLRAYRAYGRLRPDSNYRAWLYRIASNCAYTALARERRQAARQVPLEETSGGLAGPDAQSPHRQAVLHETLADLRAAVAALPVKQRMAVVMRHVQGLAYPEIAQALACSEESARANVYQATRRLRRDLGQAIAATLSERALYE